MLYGRQLTYAIVWCEELQISWPNTKENAVETAAGFSSISTNHVMTECVAVLNGYHMWTIYRSQD